LRLARFELRGTGFSIADLGMRVLDFIKMRNTEYFKFELVKLTAIRIKQLQEE